MESTNPTLPVPVLSREQTLANMEDRKHAAIDVERLIPQHPRLRYWECLKELCEARIALLMPGNQPKEVVPEGALSTEEAVDFHGNVQFPAGKFAGSLVCEVPCEYILWWLEGNEFNKRLRRYAKSRVFQDRQDRESTDG